MAVSDLDFSMDAISGRMEVNRMRNNVSINVAEDDDFYSIDIDDSRALLASEPRGVEVIEENVEPGILNVLSKFESTDYDRCESYLELNEERTKRYNFIVRHYLTPYFVLSLIGVVIALIACAVDISIEELSQLKYASLSKYLNEYITQGKLYIPALLWITYNIVPVFIGATLVAFVEPVAAGSGIPPVKSYLNGVNIPRLLRFKTLLVKSIGVVCSVVGGLAAGKEGPMVHSGAVVAAGISQGKSSTFNVDFGIFQNYREDKKRQDFVSAGAAAGVSAAFGAPVGGVSFCLEEGISVWNLASILKFGIVAAVSTITLKLVLSRYYGDPDILYYPALSNLDLSYQLHEIPIFMLMGLFGGLSGAMWNCFNYRLSILRLKYLNNRCLKVVESCLISALTAIVALLMMYFIHDCKSLGQDSIKFPTQMYCKNNEYSVVASLWLQTPITSIRSLLQDPPDTYNWLSLSVFAIFYHLISSVTFGLASSNGIFIPCLLTGAAWGRLMSIGLVHVLPDVSLALPGSYALIGAAAQLGGVTRLRISLIFIIMETITQCNFALPLLVTLIVAKLTGDFFNESIYDTHMQLSGVSVLPCELPPLASNIYASGVMSHPVVTLKTVENVGYIIELLKRTTYNGFPVVDPPMSDQIDVTEYGKLRGLILRSKLLLILHFKLFNETFDEWEDITASDFRNKYPNYPNVEDIIVSEETKTYSVDLRPFMNPTPYTVLHSMSLHRMFKLFRALELRHLLIMNDATEVIGMVTRKDLARYLEWHSNGCMGITELIVQRNRN